MPHTRFWVVVNNAATIGFSLLFHVWWTTRVNACFVRTEVRQQGLLCCAPVNAHAAISQADQEICGPGDQIDYDEAECPPAHSRQPSYYALLSSVLSELSGKHMYRSAQTGPPGLGRRALCASRIDFFGNVAISCSLSTFLLTYD